MKRQCAPAAVGLAGELPDCSGVGSSGQHRVLRRLVGFVFSLEQG